MNLTPTNMDYIQTKDGVATYYQGIGWRGSVSTLNPGEGFIYKSKATTDKTTNIKIKKPKLPITINSYNYNHSLDKTVEVTAIEFEFGRKSSDGTTSVKMYITSVMKYVSKGPNVSANGEIGYKLKDSEGIIIESGTFFTESTLEGETSRKYAYLSSGLPDGNYELVILNSIDE